MGFWNIDRFDFTDQLNAEIWARSGSLQVEIQPLEQLQQAYAVGAQQAMLPPDIAAQLGGSLPWVPDLLGRRWQEETSVLVVGSAYAGFIREFSRRDACLGLDEYVASVNNDAGVFQRAFLRSVVTRDEDYYEPVRRLVQPIVGTADQLAIFDLCRASFVRRGSDEHRKDKGGDSVVRTAPEYSPMSSMKRLKTGYGDD